MDANGINSSNAGLFNNVPLSNDFDRAIRNNNSNDVFSPSSYSTSSNDVEYDLDIFEFFDDSYTIDQASRFAHMIIIILNKCFQLDSEHDIVSLKLVDLVVDQTYGNRLTLRKLNPSSGSNNYHYINTVQRQTDISKCPIFGIGLYLLYFYHSSPITFENYNTLPLIKLSSQYINFSMFKYANERGVLDSSARFAIKLDTNDNKLEDYCKTLFPWLEKLEDDFYQKDRTNYALSLLIELFKYISSTIVQDLIYLNTLSDMQSHNLLQTFRFFFDMPIINNLKRSIVSKNRSVKNEIFEIREDIQLLKDMMMKQIELQSKLLETLNNNVSSRANLLNNGRLGAMSNKNGNSPNPALLNASNFQGYGATTGISMPQVLATSDNNTSENRPNDNNADGNGENEVSFENGLNNNAPSNFHNDLPSAAHNNLGNTNINATAMASPMFGNLLQGGTPSLMIPPLHKLSPYVPGSPAPRPFKTTMASPNMFLANIADANSPSLTSSNNVAGSQLHQQQQLNQLQQQQQQQPPQQQQQPPPPPQQQQQQQQQNKTIQLTQQQQQQQSQYSMGAPASAYINSDVTASIADTTANPDNTNENNNFSNRFLPNSLDARIAESTNNNMNMNSRYGNSALRMQLPLSNLISATNRDTSAENTPLGSSQPLVRSPSVTNMLGAISALNTNSLNPPPLTTTMSNTDTVSNNLEKEENNLESMKKDASALMSLAKLKNGGINDKTNKPKTKKPEKSKRGRKAKTKALSQASVDVTDGMQDANEQHGDTNLDSSSSSTSNSGFGQNPASNSGNGLVQLNGDTTKKVTKSRDSEFKIRKNHDIKYKLCRENKTIHDLYQEWYHGLDDGKKPSIKSLIQQFGWRRWKVMDDSHFFPTRRIIIDYIEKETSLGFSNDKFNINLVSREDARKSVADDLESFRVGNALSLNSISLLLKNMKKNQDFTIYTGSKINLPKNEPKPETKEDSEIIVGQEGYLLRKLTETEKNNLCKKSIGG